jgi:hypothetical protein
MYWTVLYCTVLYGTILYYIVLYVLNCILRYCTVLSLLYSDKLSQTCNSCEVLVLCDIVVAFLKRTNFHYFLYPFPFFFLTGSILKSVFRPYRIYSDGICYSQTFLVPKISTVNPLSTLHYVKLYLLAAGLYGNTTVFSSFQDRALSAQFINIQFLPASQETTCVHFKDKPFNVVQQNKKSLLW